MTFNGGTFAGDFRKSSLAANVLLYLERMAASLFCPPSDNSPTVFSCFNAGCSFRSSSKPGPSWPSSLGLDRMLNTLFTTEAIFFLSELKATSAVFVATATNMPDSTVRGFSPWLVTSTLSFPAFTLWHIGVTVNGSSSQLSLSAPSVT